MAPRPFAPAGAPWRRWVTAAFGTLLLALAPLVAHSQTADTVVVTWTAAGDDGRTGAAAAYDLRVSEAPITADNFSAATAVEGLPAPAASGTRQGVTVRGLTRGTTYYFAIRSVDDAGNWSAISNVLEWDWILDTAPPGMPHGLTATKDGDDVRLAWGANADADLRGYRVYRATSASGPWDEVTTSALIATEFVDTGVPAGAEAVFYQISAVDVAGNESAHTAAVSVTMHVEVTRVTVEAPYPNPSHGDAPVQIPVVVPAGASGPAVIDIVNNGGMRVRRIEWNLAEGRQEVRWDGRNDAGRVVAPGVYRAWLIVGDTRTSIRLLRVP